MAQSRVRLGGQAITGARDEQQDAFAAGLALLAGGRSAKLAVVVDGMGGHAGGAVAAGVALAAFLRAAESGRWASFPETLRAALDIANDAIAARVDLEPRYRGMGCTLVAAIFDNDSLWTISVGDSLLLRVGTTALERLNADHSMAPLADGAEAMDGANQQRHLLRSALTGGAIALIDENRFVLAGDTRIVLASDGLLTLAPAAILETLLGMSGREPEQQAQALLDAVDALAQPDQDNCTVIVVECRAPSAGSRFLRQAIGSLVIAAGMGMIGYVWWIARDVRSPATPPREQAMHAPPVAIPAAAPAWRDGYPVEHDEPAPAASRPVAAKLASGRPAPAAGNNAAPARGKLVLDLPALLLENTVTVAVDDRKPIDAKTSPAPARLSPGTPSPPIAPRPLGPRDQER